VSAPAAGIVTNLSVARGDGVTSGQPLVSLESPGLVSLQRDYLHAVAQDVLTSQQLKRNTELFEAKAVPQRVLEATTEQVKGHADEVLVRTILERRDAARLLARLKTAFVGTRLVYWIVPVTEFGAVDDHEDKTGI
jgi:multidrug efflux pump subunit AcrA (membrane-fusion protein)